MVYNVGDTWTCGACGDSYTVTKEGVRCRKPGHQVYLSLEYLQGYKPINTTGQTTLF